MSVLSTYDFKVWIAELFCGNEGCLMLPIKLWCLSKPENVSFRNIWNSAGVKSFPCLPARATENFWVFTSNQQFKMSSSVVGQIMKIMTTALHWLHNRNRVSNYSHLNVCSFSLISAQPKIDPKMTKLYK